MANLRRVSIAFADSLSMQDSKAGHVTRRVLVVDDEEMVRAFAALALEEEGYEVHQAGDASEAAYIWSREEGAFDVLLADVSLPGRSGLELAENLLALNPDLGVVFATGFEESAVPGVNATSPQFGYLPKPYSVKALLDAVKRALPKSSPADT